MNNILLNSKFIVNPKNYLISPSGSSVFKWIIIFSNLYNINKSPVYNNDNITKLKLGTLSIGKGILYQAFYPITPCVTLHSSISLF